MGSTGTPIGEGTIARKTIRKPLSLRTNIAWSFWGQGVYAACQWGVVVVLAKLGSVEQVGRLAFAFAVTAPIVMFANLQLRNALATDANDEFAFREYLRLRIVTIVGGVFVIAAVSLTASWPLHLSLVVVVVGLAKSFESLSDIHWGLMQRYQRLDLVAISMFVKGVLSLLAFWAALHLTGSLIHSVLALLCVWAATLLFYDIPRARTLIQTELPESCQNHVMRSSHNRLTRLFWAVLPLGFVTALESLNANVPRYAIQRYLGEGSLGIYAGMAYAQTAFMIFTRSLEQSASPKLAVYWSEGRHHEFGKLILRLVFAVTAAGVACIAVVVALGKDLLSFAYRPEYAEDIDVFTMLTTATMFISIGLTGVFGLMAIRRFGTQVFLHGAMGLTTAVACILLVPRHGLSGAAWALLLSAILFAILSMSVLIHFYRQHVDSHGLSRHSEEKREE